jgi:hypothetical protein
MNQDELFEQEEKCLKAIRTVRKAVLMRIVVTGMLIWAVVVNPAQLWTSGLLVLVMILNLVGSLPLVTEWKKQKQLLKELIAQEE